MTPRAHVKGSRAYLAVGVMNIRCLQNKSLSPTFARGPSRPPPPRPLIGPQHKFRFDQEFTIINLGPAINPPRQVSVHRVPISISHGVGGGCGWEQNNVVRWLGRSERSWFGRIGWWILGKSYRPDWTDWNFTVGRTTGTIGRRRHGHDIRGKRSIVEGRTNRLRGDNSDIWRTK
jgi:hypothetical protein